MLCLKILSMRLALREPPVSGTGLSYIRLLFCRRARPALLLADLHSYQPSVMAACRELCPPELLLSSVCKSSNFEMHKPKVWC